MTWGIVCETNRVEYAINVNGKEENFVSKGIVFVNREITTEPSSAYKGPEDDVMTDKYSAESEHGDFVWEVVARRAGFDGHASIESTEVTIPESCKLLIDAKFDIQENE